MDGFDPYNGCEIDCNHDLARGVSYEELAGHDGPFLPVDAMRWPLTIEDVAEDRAA